MTLRNKRKKLRKSPSWELGFSGKRETPKSTIVYRKGKYRAGKNKTHSKYDHKLSENKDNLRVYKKLMFNICWNLVDVKSFKNSENLRVKTP